MNLNTTLNSSKRFIENTIFIYSLILSNIYYYLYHTIFLFQKDIELKSVEILFLCFFFDWLVLNSSLLHVYINI